jgi:toxin-antitoxin system PIN domain toxin
VTILDVNILIYAYNPDAPQHPLASVWLERLFNGPDAIGIPWVTIWAFLRLTTNPRLSTHRKMEAIALQTVRSWLAHPGVVLVQPGPRHLEILERLIVEDQASGPLVSDATLAALALENGAGLASTDKDFKRFSGLRWINPLAANPFV